MIMKAVNFLKTMTSLLLALCMSCPGITAPSPAYAKTEADDGGAGWDSAQDGTDQDGMSQNETAPAASLGLKAPCALLMEAGTGTILYQKNEHEKRAPASVTKIMTLNLIFDAIEKKQIALTDEVTVSDHAAGMGGSQVYLEPGEVQTVEDLIKCISIASANDACVAMAEYICGSEEEFVSQMNQKAEKLGMKDTHFVNCCGLTADGHVTSAYDIALMSRELSAGHPQIHDYCTIWMDTITHTTKRGSSEFGLANTNKLLKQYPYATGLKTGYTSEAKYCLSATAEKDGVSLIAVLMGAPDPKARTADIRMLLDYGFSVCRVYRDENPGKLPRLAVRHGSADSVALSYEGTMCYVSASAENLESVTKKRTLPESADAPVKKGSVAGKLTYYLNDKEIGHVNILYAEEIPRASFGDYYKNLIVRLFSL